MAATQKKVRVWMQVIVSATVLAAGLLILTAPNIVLQRSLDEGTKRFAAAWVGAVIGYWLS